jgi:quinol monooxygenase YgiN
LERAVQKTTGGTDEKDNDGLVIVAAALMSGGSTAHAADEPIVVTARFYITPGQEAAYEEFGKKVVEYVRRAEPDIIYRLQRSIKDPSVFVFYKVYQSEAAFDNHVKVVLPALTKEIGPCPEGILARAPEVEKFRPEEK